MEPSGATPILTSKHSPNLTGSHVPLKGAGGGSKKAGIFFTKFEGRAFLRLCFSQKQTGEAS